MGFENFKFNLTKKALTRSMRYLPRPALPITLSILNGICNASQTFGLQGLAFKALCFVSFHSLARLSYLVPLAANKIDDKNCIDFGFEEDRYRLYR